MRVLACGDRNWDDIEKIVQVLNEFPFDTVIIHGAAPGADTIAGVVAHEMGLKVEAYPADWSLGKKAGPIRNAKMLKDGKPDLVIAFHNNIASSKGTANMIAQAKKAGVKVIVYTSDSNAKA